MKLDLNFQFTGLDGKDITGDTAAKYLGSILAIKTKNLEPGRANLIANDLYQNGLVEIDNDDLGNLEKDLSEKDSPVHQRLQNNFLVKIQSAIAEAKKKSEAKTVSEEKPKTNS